MSKKNYSAKPPSSSSDQVAGLANPSGEKTLPNQDKNELQLITDNEDAMLVMMLFILFNRELNLEDLLNRFKNNPTDEGLKNLVRRRFDRAIRGTDKKEYLRSLIPFFQFMMRSISI